MRCGHRTLRFVRKNAHSVEVDILRQSSIKAHFVGVDDHIDPRSEENRLGSLIGRRSRLRGFVKGLLIFKLTPPTSAQSVAAKVIMGSSSGGAVGKAD